MFNRRREAKRQRFIRDRHPVVSWPAMSAVQNAARHIVQAELIRAANEPETPGYYTALEWSSDVRR